MRCVLSGWVRWCELVVFRIHVSPQAPVVVSYSWSCALAASNRPSRAISRGLVAFVCVWPCSWQVITATQQQCARRPRSLFCSVYIRRERVHARHSLLVSSAGASIFHETRRGSRARCRAPPPDSPRRRSSSNWSVGYRWARVCSRIACGLVVLMRLSILVAVRDAAPRCMAGGVGCLGGVARARVRSLAALPRHIRHNGAPARSRFSVCST